MELFPYTIHNMRFVLYPVSVLLISIFIFTSILPLIADYCFRKATSYELRATDSAGRIVTAIRYTLNAIKYDSANATYHYELGKIYFKLNQLKDATAQYKKAVQLNPANSKYHQSLAWAYGDMGRNEEAIQEFEKTVSSEPNNPYRHRAYAIYCFNQAKSINSDTDKMTDSINPKESLLNTAISEYLQTVNIDSSFAREAIEKLFLFTRDYNQLKQILPDLPKFHVILADFLQEKNVWLENEERFRTEMSDAADKAPYYIAIARWHYRCKDYNKAFSFLYDYLRLYPDNAEIHFTIADFAIYGSRDWELAYKEVNKALGLKPGNIYYRYWYAKWLSYQKNYKEAESECKKILSLNPYHKDTLELLSQCRSMSIEMARDKNNF